MPERVQIESESPKKMKGEKTAAIGQLSSKNLGGMNRELDDRVLGLGA